MNSSSKVLVTLSSSFSSTKRLFFLFQRGFSSPIASTLPKENNESDSGKADPAPGKAESAPEKAESAPGKAESATLEADLTAGKCWRESSASFAQKAMAGATTVGSVIDLATKTGNIVGLGKATAEMGPIEVWKKIQEKFNLFDEDKEELKSAIKTICDRLVCIESEIKVNNEMIKELLSKSSSFKSGGAVGMKSEKEDNKTQEEEANEKVSFFGKFGKFWYGSGKGNGKGNGNGNGNGNGCEGGD